MKQFSFFIAVLFGIATFTGCAPRWVRTPVVDEKELTVSLEHKIVKKEVVKQQFSHPIDIDQQDLTVFLTQLAYLAEPVIYGKPEEKPVFQEKEIERLAPALAGALAKADPDQRVRFVSHNRGGGLLFKKQRQTSGVAFVDTGNRLNLAFADVNYELLPNRPDSFSQGEEYPDPLGIKSSFTPLIAPAYAEHRRTGKDKPFPLWIAADLEKIAAAAEAVPESATGKPEPAAAQPAAAPAPETAPAPEKKAVVEKKAPVEKPDTSWETRKQESREKLRYLKELYESGLIDENEYKAQKEKLLEQL